MASDQVLKNLYETLGKLDKVDVEKLLRKGLGNEALEHTFLPNLTEIHKLRDFVRQYAPRVHDEFVNQARQTFENLAALMTNQANAASSEYISQRDNFVIQVENALGESRRWRTHFIATAVEERGFLQDEGIRQEYQNAVKELQERSESTLARVKEEADKALQEARALAEEIEARARKTATKISMKDAQDQFHAASVELKKQVVFWRWASAVATAILIATAAGFLYTPVPTGDDWPVAFYHTVIRVFVLSAVGAVSAFAFRMLRAHMHMAAKNEHRVRVANSAESFVNAALEPQQRDLLLAKIAETIIDFGDSGIIKGDRDDHDSAVLSGDLLGRILAAVTRK